jgi:hypothetical protein
MPLSGDGYLVAKSCVRILRLSQDASAAVNDGVRHTGHARRLHRQFVKRSCPLYSRARCFSPSVCDIHRLNHIKFRLRR